MTNGVLRTKLPLAHERAKELLSYDPATGTLTWRKDRAGGIKAGSKAGAVCGRYGQICIDDESYKTHRVIWFLVTGKWPACLIDHRDGDGLNNRWANLREATFRQNSMNRRASRKSKTGRIGVCPDKQSGKWEAFICIDSRTKHLGKFECFDDAVAVRCEAEKHYFGDFARQVKAFKNLTKPDIAGGNRSAPQQAGAGAQSVVSSRMAEGGGNV